MNETCKDCGKPIHFVEHENRWYHDGLNDILACPSTDLILKPAARPEA